MAFAACDAPSPSDAPADPWPRAAACEDLEDWPEAWAELESEALARIDELRAEGADCGERGKLGPAPALRRRAALDCAARFHAQDMAERGYFGRFDPEGNDERDRADAAGYSPARPEQVRLVQHVAAGPRDAEELVDRTWLPRAVPCESLASSAATEVGIGVVDELEGEHATRWVVVLAVDELDAP